MWTYIQAVSFDFDEPNGGESNLYKRVGRVLA